MALRATIGLIVLLIWTGISGCTAVTKSQTKVRTGISSWYSTEACLVNPDPACPMANGRSLYEQETTTPYFAASWDHECGTSLQVNRRGAVQVAGVRVEVTDRGPAKRLYAQGRILDLSRQAFQAVCGDLDQGLCEVTVRPL